MIQADHYKIFLNKQCKIRFNDDFVLIGEVLDANNAGFIFRTDQKTSFINWSQVKTVMPQED